MNRREILAVAAGIPATAWLGSGGRARTPRGSAGSLRDASDSILSESPRGYLFFDAAEARFIEAACNRLIPADGAGAGALSAGVLAYMDAHLAGAWGNGEDIYRGGPWQPGTPEALPTAHSASPAELFRAGLAAVLRDLADRGPPFGELSTAAQDSYLARLATGASIGASVRIFFDMLLLMTIEGFFINPHHGGRRDRVSWPLQGFPGAFARVSTAADRCSRRQKA